jgi:hypothetical protein
VIRLISEAPKGLWIKTFCDSPVQKVFFLPVKM